MPKIKIIYSNYKNLVVLLLIGVVFIIYCDPFSMYFLNDDFDSLPNYAKGNFFNNGGMRLTEEASIMVDNWLYHTNAWGYILTNICIHIAVCAMGFIWLKKISVSLNSYFGRYTYLCIPILFMWYAFHTEAVVWPDCRTASLGLLFFLLAWNALLQGSVKNSFLIWLSLPAFVVGIFSYEYCWLYPLSITIWWFLLEKGTVYRTKKTFLTILCSWLLLAVYFPVRKFLVTEWIGSYLSHNIEKPSYQAFVKNCFALFGRSFLPPMENKIALAILTIVILSLLSIVSYKLWQQEKLTKLWWLLLCNWLLSYVFFVSLGIDSNGYESERYLYAPSFFLCAWLVYTCVLLSFKKQLSSLLFASFLAFHIFFLSISLNAYRKAGNLCKETIAIIKKNLGSKVIFITGLPTKSYGIPTFGLGLNKTVKWYYPSSDTASIKTVSVAQFKWKEQVIIHASTDLKTGNITIHFSTSDHTSAK